MRRPPRPSLLALIVAALAFAVAGCGGGEIAAEEVPGAPPALIVPSDSELASASESDDAADTTASTDDSASADESAATQAPADTGATTPPADTSGGTVAAPEPTAAPEDSAANDTAPAPGSEAEQFESFCEQNAGAC
jgi:hypothetical protein